jgi:hypothetical protein
LLKTLLGAALLISLAGCGGGGSTGTADSGAGSGGGGGGAGAVTASVALEWEAPTTRADGTALTDLAGFRVYYGTQSGNYSSSVDIGDATSVLIEDLAVETTYFFAVTTYDSSGNESEPSNEISRAL